jgi:tetratricopeptide (TPR) repeat protein
MQCPNPECNSPAISIKTRTVIADPGPNAIASFFLKRNTIYPLQVFATFSLVIGIFLIISGILGGLDIRWLFLCAVIFIIVAGFLANSSAKVLKIHLSRYKCSQCRYKWDFFWPDANETPGKLKLAEWNLQKALQGRKKVRLAYAYNNMTAFTCAYRGDCYQSAVFAEQSLKLFQELDDKKGLSYALLNLGTSLMYQGQYDTAYRLLHQALNLCQEQKDWLGIAVSYQSLGTVLLLQSRYEAARPLLTYGFEMFYKLDAKERIALGFTHLAEIAMTQQQQLVRAAQLFGAAEALREAHNIAISPLVNPRYEQTVTALSKQLDAPSFLFNWRQGKALPLAQAVKFALS